MSHIPKRCLGSRKQQTQWCAAGASPESHKQAATQAGVRRRPSALNLSPSAAQDARGQAEKKWLVLALHEAPAPGPKGSAVPGRAGVPKDPLGRVVLDLADFAAEDGRATRTLAVSFATPAVKAAASVPAKMLITIGCATGAPCVAVCAF